MPSLHIAELVGVDPVQGVRHAHLDRLDGLVALDPRGEALILLLVLDPGVVPCEALPPCHLMTTILMTPAFPRLGLHTLVIRFTILGSSRSRS